MRNAGAGRRHFVRHDGPCGNLPGVGVDQETDAQEDERDAQDLAHVQRHALFEGDLRFLDELDEETHAEADDEEDADERPPVGLVKTFPIQPEEEEAQEKVGERFVKLGGMLVVCP